MQPKVPVKKLLQKYNLPFTNEGREKMAEVYVLTTSFVCFILNELTQKGPIDQKACDELLEAMGLRKLNE